MGMENCRTGCLYVPDLPLWALLRAEPELSNAPVAVTGSEGPRAVVLACSALAHRAGVGVGMTAAQARSLLAGLVVRTLSAPQVRSAQAALLDAARSFSPRVALEPGEEVCLDLSGLTGLHSSERRLGAALLQRVERAGLPARVGIASGKFIARLAARTTEGVQVIAAGEERAFLGPLPVRLLEASADLLATLRRFGIERFGELADLPSRDLGPRLGSEGLRLYRLARGEDQSPLVPMKVPERFVEETETPYPVGQIEPLLFVLNGVLERLAERLRWRGLTAERLFLSLGLDPSGSDERFVGLASPTCRVNTWTTVLRLALEEQPPRAPVTAVRAEAEARAQRSSQVEMFAPQKPAPEKLDDAIAYLASLAGEGRVGSPRLVDSHRPGEFVVVPFGQPAAAGKNILGSRLPLRVFRPGREVEVRLDKTIPRYLRGKEIRGRVLQFAGPWRLEGEWWEAEALLRDYYHVELTDGGIYRLYHSIDRWFVDAICG
jgi:protein ImuB